jgi:hypothetical protein
MHPASGRVGKTCRLWTLNLDASTVRADYYGNLLLYFAITTKMGSFI